MIRKICLGVIGFVVLLFIFGSMFGSTDSNITSSDHGNNSSVKVFTDGTYKVGSDLPAGEYKFTQTESFGAGYVERSSDSSMELGSIISNDLTNEEGESRYISVNDGEYLKIQGGELVKV